MSPSTPAAPAAATPPTWLTFLVGLSVVSAATAWVTFGPQPPNTVSTANAAAVPVADPADLSGDTMGVTWSVKTGGEPVADPAALRTAINAALDRLDRDLSTYRDDSAVSTFNAHRGADWFPVPADVAHIVAAARTVSEHTDGAFDVTVGALVDLWGFGPAAARGETRGVPTDAQIAAAKVHVDYRKLHARLDPPALRKDDPLISVDLGGIAKGYAAARVAAVLDARGVKDYLVSVGGELRARGLSPAGRPWRVGVEVPTPDTRRVLRQLELRDCAVSTSGDYRQFFEIDGRRYCHEIDPRTGRPVNHALASVSVLHPDAAYADGMATGLMVLGQDRGAEVAEKLALGVLLVHRNPAQSQFETQTTPEFDRTLVTTRHPGPTLVRAR